MPLERERCSKVINKLVDNIILIKSALSEDPPSIIIIREFPGSEAHVEFERSLFVLNIIYYNFISAVRDQANSTKSLSKLKYAKNTTDFNVQLKQ